MGSVAKGLALGATATAPKVSLAFLQLDRIGAVLCGNRFFSHGFGPFYRDIGAKRLEVLLPVGLSLIMRKVEIKTARTNLVGP